MSLKKLCLAGASVLAITTATATNAGAVIQLGFILDSSGSIGSTNWNTIRTGLSNALGILPTDGSYSVAVVKFASGASTVVTNTLIDSANALSTVQSSISTTAYLGGNTNYEAAFNQMISALGGGAGIATATATYVNFATDGEPNRGNENAAFLQNILTSAGVDNISIEGISIGSGGKTYLTSGICYPGPCHDGLSGVTFPTQGFYIGVANAQGYADVITAKVGTITGIPVPEPMSLALFGMGLAGLGLMRRRAA